MWAGFRSVPAVFLVAIVTVPAVLYVYNVISFIVTDICLIRYITLSTNNFGISD